MAYPSIELIELYEPKQLSKFWRVFSRYVLCKVGIGHIFTEDVGQSVVDCQLCGYIKKLQLDFYGNGTPCHSSTHLLLEKILDKKYESLGLTKDESLSLKRDLEENRSLINMSKYSEEIYPYPCRDEWSLDVLEQILKKQEGMRENLNTWLKKGNLINGYRFIFFDLGYL